MENEIEIRPHLEYFDQNPQPQVEETPLSYTLVFRRRIWDTVVHLYSQGFFKLLIEDMYVAISSLLIFTEGFMELDKTGSVSPLVLSLFKYSFAVFNTISFSRLTIFIPSNRINTRYLCLLLAALASHFLNPFISEIFKVLVYMTFDYCWVFFNHINDNIVRKQDRDFVRKVALAYAFWLSHSLISLGWIVMNISPDLVLVLSIVIGKVCSSIHEACRTANYALPILDKSIEKLLPASAVRVASIWKENQGMVKLIQFALGLGGSIIFQSCFQIKTVRDVDMFYAFATAWAINLCLFSTSGDLGILNFLLGNMVAGGAVNQFGLGITTWLAFAGSLLLYALRLVTKTRRTTYPTCD